MIDCRYCRVASSSCFELIGLSLVGFRKLALLRSGRGAGFLEQHQEVPPVDARRERYYIQIHPVEAVLEFGRDVLLFDGLAGALGALHGVAEIQQ